MLAKYWKKIGMLILIIACIFNVMGKLISKLSLDKEMLSSAQYVYDKNDEENKENGQSKDSKENTENNKNRENKQNNT